MQARQTLATHIELVQLPETGLFPRCIRRLEVSSLAPPFGTDADQLSSIVDPEWNCVRLCTLTTKILIVGLMAYRPRNQSKRTKKLSAPANEEEIQAFYAACAKVEVEPADTLRKLAKAFVDHANEHGQIVQPIRFQTAARGK